MAGAQDLVEHWRWVDEGASLVKKSVEQNETEREDVRRVQGLNGCRAG